MESEKFKRMDRERLFSRVEQSKKKQEKKGGNFTAKGTIKGPQRFLFFLGMLIFMFLWAGAALRSGSEGEMLAWAGEKKSESSKAAFKAGPMVKLAPLVINLNEENGRHYVKTTIVLEVGREEWIEEVQKRIPTLADMVILTLCDKKLQDLKQPHYKEELRKELLARAHQALNSSKIKQIYFDEFLYQ